MRQNEASKHVWNLESVLAALPQVPTGYETNLSGVCNENWDDTLMQLLGRVPPKTPHLELQNT